MKILIVDDHQYNRDLLSFILEDEGYDCVEASDGLQAFGILESDVNEEINLILMDINMPVMDGVTATQKIKEAFPDRFLPILFVTALDDSEVITKCLGVGGDDFVPKPINEEVLLAKIKAHARSQNTYNTLKIANEKLNYHQQLVDREHAIVDHVFNNRDKRVKTLCDNVMAYTSPMSMFDGDLVLITPSPTGGVYFIVGDFTGHGLSAAIGSLPVTEIFFSFTSRHASVGQIAKEIHIRLMELLPDNMFFCASIGEIDYSGRTLTIWSGGMNDILCRHEKNHMLSKIASAHMPLGILTEEEFDASPTVIDFEKNTKIYIYTDGINEAENSSGDEFGLERLEKLILHGGDNVVNKIVQNVREFIAGKDQTDDLSIMEITTGEIIHRSKNTKDIVDIGMEYHNVESFPWALTMTLKGKDLQATSVVDQIMSFVSALQGIELHQDKIYTIVSELYSNALEHGILRLPSSLKTTADGFEEYYKLRASRLAEITDDAIHIEFKYLRGNPNQIILIMTDTGGGFDFESEEYVALQNDGAYGRGGSLLKSLCSFIDYSDGGRTVTAIYDLCFH